MLYFVFWILVFLLLGRTAISVPPADQRVIKGTTAVLNCDATHDPRINIRYPSINVFIKCIPNFIDSPLCLKWFMLMRCSFMWDRGSVPVKPSSGGRVSVRQGSLTISQTWSGDIGDYTCTVTSKAGKDSRSARLEVM